MAIIVFRNAEYFCIAFTFVEYAKSFYNCLVFVKPISVSHYLCHLKNKETKLHLNIYTGSQHMRLLKKILVLSINNNSH